MNTGTYKHIDGAWRKVSDSASGPSDVYFRGPHFEPNLGDEKNVNGRFINSRNEKARILKEQGLREAGDRVHGSR